MNQSLVNILLIAHSRPSYFKRVLSGILSSKTPINQLCIAFDGPVNSAIQEQIEYIQSYCNEDLYTILTSSYNMGCEVRVLSAMDTIFNDFGWESAFILEDDMVPSPSYFTICNNIRTWLNNPRCDYSSQKFIVQGWNENLVQKNAINKLHNCIENTQCHWWGYLIERNIYKSMQPILSLYRPMVEGIPYASRNHSKITGLLKPLKDAGIHRLKNRSSSESFFPVNIQELDRISKVDGFRQDYAIACSAIYGEVLKIAPYISRGTAIGEQGLDFNPALFRSMNLHLIEGYDDFTAPTIFQVLTN